MATNGRRRTKGAGSIIHRKDGSWEFRREVGRDPATGKRRYVSAKGRTKAARANGSTRGSRRWSAPVCCPEPSRRI